MKKEGKLYFIKKAKIYILILIFILVIYVGVFYFFHYHKNLEYSNAYSCKVDEDCTIKITYCDKNCTPCPCINYGCINKDIEYQLYCPIPTGASCPPAPPWVTNCKCINFQCIDCRGDVCISSLT